MGSLFGASICFVKIMKHEIMIDQFEEEKIA